MARKLVIAPLALVLVLAAGGCATKKYTRAEVGGAEERLNDRIAGVEDLVEDSQEQITEQREQIGEVSVTAREALDRALAAGKLAEGKFLYETVLSDDRVRFEFDRAELGPEAHAALDEFATDLAARNENVFIEVQGHTDSIGSETYNQELGLRRAEAVRAYLNRKHSFPLHRMSVISYGESAPAADNGTREGRAQNRRVALVVLK